MPMQKEYSGIFVSNFNLQNYINILENDSESPEIRTIQAPYGQVLNVLLDNKENNNYDFGFLWVQPQAVIDSFNKLINGQLIPTSVIINEVDEFCRAVINFSKTLKFLFVASWNMPYYNRGWGILDLKNNLGISNNLMRMNLRLSDNFNDFKNIFILDSQKWVDAAGKDAYNSKLWFLSKIPFDNIVFKQAMRELKSAIKTISGESKKIIILDLDNTLWGGIVGDVGWENLRLGGHDFIGESFVEFQLGLKALKNRGIILAVVSKNEESVALEAISKHPEMVLKKEDFVGWEINWDDKSKNIQNLLKKINLGPQAAVFLDDNPVERARVRESLPEICVPELPQNVMEYTKALNQLNCFDVINPTKEDLERTNLYLADNERQKLKTELNSLEDWLKSLKTIVTIEELNNQNIQRAAQLFNKTNQMNLTTRRLGESELIQWANQNNHKLWTIRVSDKFSDSGLTGIISLEIENKTALIADFLLSCRVMGRKIEEVMLINVINYSINNGIEKIIAKFSHTPKNKPCFDFWKEKSGFFFIQEENSFVWDFLSPFPEITQIEIKNNY
jgi:FkbH-like protein